MKRISIGLMLALVLQGPALGIPGKITYQGTLKEKSVPVNATKTMRFRLTNQQGTQVYWSSSDMSVAVTQGLFSVELEPTGVNWQGVTPYIEVSIEGQALSPREPINASAYATISADIVDGAITPAKVASGYGLVPSGAILMFAGPCPTGWTRFAAMDNSFPMGTATYGPIGGATTHSHSITSSGQHLHTTPAISLGTGQSGAYSTVYQTVSSPGWVPLYPGQNTNSAGDHNHGGNTAQASSLPPYVGIVFCQKQ